MKNEHSRFGLTAEHRGISLRLIGDWQDLAGYYEGDDGNAPAYGLRDARRTPGYATGRAFLYLCDEHWRR